MQCWRGRSDVFQITEDAAGIQHSVDFGVEDALTLMHKRMDRKARNDSIKLAQVGKRVVEVMGDYGYGGIAGKALSGGLDHSRGEVDGDRFRVRMLAFYQRQQSSVSSTQI